jgi:hypothetical protein
MGIGHSTDTPILVAPFGISSFISLVDDLLLRPFCSLRPFSPLLGRISSLPKKARRVYFTPFKGRKNRRGASVRFNCLFQ